MDAEAVIARLRAHRAELEAAGVAHAGVFGSVARGEAGPGSDIDVLIDFAPDHRPTIYDYVEAKQRVAALFDGHVDVVARVALAARMRDAVLRDVIHAF